MMSKKDFQQFADAIAQIYNADVREQFIRLLCPILKANNYKFDEDRFREWIDRRIRGTTQGLG